MYSAWVDEKHRIVSFTRQAGFQRRDFETHQEMFLFVIHLGYEGYAIF